MPHYLHGLKGDYTYTVSRESDDDGMKYIPKFTEVRDENKTGSILHRCETGGALFDNQSLDGGST